MELSESKNACVIWPFVADISKYLSELSVRLQGPDSGSLLSNVKSSEASERATSLL